MFTDRDRLQLAHLGISEVQVMQQLANFRNGFPFSHLVKPAVVGDGITGLSEKGANEMASFYDRHSGSLNLIKFVPASGAATRMFKDLYSFWNELESHNELDNLLKKYPDVTFFFDNIRSFPFTRDLDRALGNKLDTCLLSKSYDIILHCLLGEEGLNYGSLPKGLLKFHSYPDKSRTSVEEHWVEGALYARNGNGKVRVHFTLSPNHENKFLELVEKSKKEYENSHNIKLEISYSFQRPSTNVIAADASNQPFRESDGMMVFRPGGHGALLENLNELDADIIFIKNIDNIVHDRLKDVTVTYKKALAGILLELREKVFYYLKLIEQSPDSKLLQEASQFVKNDLHHIESDKGKPIIAEYLVSILNRPIRVCGMVKNEGEPGGGPFWVKDNAGVTTLQIVESSQIDMNEQSQREVFGRATHFNPVDLVCSIKDHHGRKFNLTDYRDPGTGFISVKSRDGKPLKAQELPGLWNGAMANWNTIFAEVPLITFNPVKTVNDLLRENHR